MWAHAHIPHQKKKKKNTNTYTYTSKTGEPLAHDRSSPPLGSTALKPSQKKKKKPTQQA